MKTILLAVSLIIMTAGRTQTQSDQFVRKSNVVSFYFHDKDTWSEFFSADNVFIINYNEHGDIMHIGPKVKEVLVRTGEAHKGKTESGKEYQIVDVKEPDGTIVQFQVFRDEEIGVKLIYHDVSVQFSTSHKIEPFN